MMYPTFNHTFRLHWQLVALVALVENDLAGQVEKICENLNVLAESEAALMSQLTTVVDLKQRQKIVDGLVLWAKSRLAVYNKPVLPFHPDEAVIFLMDQSFDKLFSEMLAGFCEDVFGSFDVLAQSAPDDLCAIVFLQFPDAAETYLAVTKLWRWAKKKVAEQGGSILVRQGGITFGPGANINNAGDITGRDKIG